MYVHGAGLASMLPGAQCIVPHSCPACIGLVYTIGTLVCRVAAAGKVTSTDESFPAQKFHAQLQPLSDKGESGTFTSFYTLEIQ